MPECREKRGSSISAFLPEVNFVNPASAFRHQGQSGTAGHGLAQLCPVQVKSHFFVQSILVGPIAIRDIRSRKLSGSAH
jgi:hypothetical protein